jgi:hypothetical protein
MVIVSVSLCKIYCWCNCKNHSFFFAARKKKQRGGDEREQDPHNKSASVTSQSEQDVATHTWECALPIIYQDFGLSHE